MAAWDADARFVRPGGSGGSDDWPDWETMALFQYPIGRQVRPYRDRHAGRLRIDPMRGAGAVPSAYAVEFTPEVSALLEAALSHRVEPAITVAGHMRRGDKRLDGIRLRVLSGEDAQVGRNEPERRSERGAVVPGAALAALVAAAAALYLWL